MPLHLGNSTIETISSYKELAAQPGVLQAVSVAQEPTKKEYITGDTIDPTGLILNVTIDGNIYQIGPEGTGNGTDKYIKVNATMGGATLDASEYTGVTLKPWVSLNNNSIQSSNGYFISITDGPAADTVLENNSWETIAKVAAAGKAQEYWNVGDTKTLYKTDGTTKFSTARIVAFDHYDYTEGGSTYNNGKNKTGITFWLEDGIGQNGQMKANPTEYILYSASDVHNVYCHNIIPDQIEQDIKSFIKTVTVVKTTSVADTFSASFFVPSAIEFGLTNNSEMEDGSTIFPYFSNGNSKTYSTSFWTRSPTGWFTDDDGSVRSFFYVSKNLPITTGSLGDVDRSYLILPIFNL